MPACPQLAGTGHDLFSCHRPLRSPADRSARRPRRTGVPPGSWGTAGSGAAGMMWAVFERGIEPGLVLGTSAGALDCAFLPAGPPCRSTTARARSTTPTSPITAGPKTKPGERCAAGGQAARSDQSNRRALFAPCTSHRPVPNARSGTGGRSLPAGHCSPGVAVRDQLKPSQGQDHVVLATQGFPRRVGLPRRCRGPDETAA
jgi:hypothetical protein